MLLEQCVALAIDHELTKSAIAVAVRKVRGRVWARQAEYDSQFEAHFRAFAEKISMISLAPVCDDLSCVGSRADWRRTFADDTALRLQSGFGRVMNRCFPAIVAAKHELDLDAFVSLSARHICKQMVDAAPAAGFMRDALWGVVNVTAQVTRCLSGDLDPMILVDPSFFTPIKPPPPLRTRTFQQPQDCN